MVLQLSKERGTELQKICILKITLVIITYDLKDMLAVPYCLDVWTAGTMRCLSAASDARQEVLSS